MNWSWAMEELRAGRRVRYTRWLQGQSIRWNPEGCFFVAEFEPGSEANVFLQMREDPRFDVVAMIMFTDLWERAPAPVIPLRRVS
jgi:hypothetical protein